MIKKLAMLLFPDGEMGGDQTGGEDARPKDSPSVEGKSMEDFVRESIGQQKEEGEKGNAQKLGKTGEGEEEVVSGPLGDDKKKEEGEEEGEEGEVEKEKADGEEEGEEAVKEGEGEGEDADGEETKDDENKEDEKGPIPYARFEEINKKAQDFEVELQRVKPLAEYQENIIKYCQQNNITDEQFKAALEVQALLNTNPEEALKRLKPVIEAVQGFTGERLPEDLQKDVDKGDISLPRAREIASLRAKSQFGTNRLDQYQRRQQQEQQVNVTKAMSTAMDGWLSSKTTTNPDFKPRMKDGVDGMYEFVTNKFVTMMQERDAKGNFTNLVTNPQQLTDLLQKSYEEVDKALRPKQKKTATKPLLDSKTGGKGGGKSMRPEEAKSLSEVVRLAAAGRV